VVSHALDHYPSPPAQPEPPYAPKYPSISPSPVVACLAFRPVQKTFPLNRIGDYPAFATEKAAPKKLTGEKSMEISFFALPSKQDSVQGRFKPTHLPISLSTKVAACVRRFETPTPLNDERTESKKDISVLTRAFLSALTLK